MQRLVTSICNTVEKNSCCCCCFFWKTRASFHIFIPFEIDINHWWQITITTRSLQFVSEWQTQSLLDWKKCIWELKRCSRSDSWHCYCFISVHASNDTPEERSADLLKDQQRSQISQRCSTPRYVQQTRSVFHNASVCSPSRETSARSIPTRPNQKESAVPLACQQGREAIHTEPSTMRRGLCDSRCQNNRKRSGRNSQSYLLLFQREGN